MEFVIWTEVKQKSTCTWLPGTSKVGRDGQCYDNSSLVGNCNGKHENLTSQFRISAMQQTNYYFSEFSVIANIVIFLMCQNVGMLACQIVIVRLLFMG